MGGRGREAIEGGREAMLGLKGAGGIWGGGPDPGPWGNPCCGCVMCGGNCDCDCDNG